MTEDVFEFPEHGDAAGPAAAAGEAGHADGARNKGLMFHVPEGQKV